MFENDMKKVFGESDREFKINFDNTLAGLKADGKKNHDRRKFFKAAAIAVAACLVFSTAAFAMNRAWGILDFISNRTYVGAVLPDAPKIVQQNLPQTVVPQDTAQPELAAFSVSEAVFDGSELYLTVKVKPLNPNVMILGMDAAPADPVGNMGPAFAGMTGTIDDYAAANGKEMYRAFIEQIQARVDFFTESDGTLDYMIYSIYKGDTVDELSLSLPCDIRTYTPDDTLVQQTTLSFTVKNTKHFAVVSSDAPVDIPDCGVRVDKVMLSASEMSVAATVKFTVTDREKYMAAANKDEGLWFEFLDDNGECLPVGTAGGNEVDSVDHSDTNYIEYWSLQAMETLPDHIVLRGYNIWDDTRYGTVTIPLSGN